MKFTIPQKELNSVLTQIDKVIPARPSNPILKGIVITANHRLVTFSSFDGEMSLELGVNAIVEVQGIICCQCKPLVNLIKLFDSAEDITISQNNGDIEISTGSSKHNFPELNINDYPELPKELLENPIEITSSELLELLLSVDYAKCTDETQAALNGVCFGKGINDGLLTLIASRGGKITAIAKGFAVDDSMSEYIIPSSAVDRLIAWLNTVADSTSITASFVRELIRFKSENFELTSRLIEAAYPAVERIIPTTFESIIDINKNPFMGAIARSALHSNNGIVSAVFTQDMVTLTSNDIEVGEGLETLECISTSEESIDLRFTAKLMMDALKAIPDQMVQLRINDPRQPLAIAGNDENSKKAVHILVPIGYSK